MPLAETKTSRLYHKALADLVFQSHSVHRDHFVAGEIQKSQLLSIKTGGCPEDCAYCPQSSRHNTGLRGGSLLSVDEVIAAVREAKTNGASRFCMGAAWREVRNGPQFDQVLEMVRVVGEMGLESCCTLGMLTPSQARRLKQAGLRAYNHNLDTSRSFYRS